MASRSDQGAFGVHQGAPSPLIRRSYRALPGAVSIGQAAQHLFVSPQTLRYYEQEGLVIPVRSVGGRRRYTGDDLSRLERIRALIIEEGLNIAGIRHLLAMLPCWEMRGCGAAHAADCLQLGDDQHPCWTNTYCRYRTSPDACRQCVVYVRAFEVLSVRRVLRAAKRLALHAKGKSG